MFDYGEVEIAKRGDVAKFSFLSFTVSCEKTKHYRLKAQAAEDDKKIEDWSCEVVIGYSCANCERECGLSGLHRAILTNEAPSSAFLIKTLACNHKNIKFTISVFLRASEPLDFGWNVKERKSRFTDEGEAKKLNANCTIRFADSDEPIFVNRELLTVYSNVLRVMFEGDFKEKNAKEVKLEVERDDFLSFIDCLYFPPVPVTGANFKTVLIMADRYECPLLLDRCKEFAKNGAKTVTSIEECKDYIEVADHLDWNEVFTMILEFMKIEGVKFFIELLDSDWILALKRATRQVLFKEMKRIFPSKAMQLVKHSTNRSQCEPKRMRFTDETEAKKLRATCKIHFKNSKVPVFVNGELLAVYSSVFRSILDEDKNTEEITLDVKRDDFLSFIDCLYFPPVPVAAYNFKVVAMTASRFNCPQLLEKCKEFAELGEKTTATVEMCKDYLEVAENLGWNHVVSIVVNSMKMRGAVLFIQLLDSDWIEERHSITQRALVAGLKEVVLSHLN